MKTRSYQLQGAPIKLPSLLPITIGVVTFEENFLDGTESFEEYKDRILAYASLLSDLDPDPEDVTWDGMGGWELVSDSPIVINEFAVEHDGEVVEPDDYLEVFFIEAAMAEVENNPRRYPNIDAEELARSELGHYVVHYDEQNGAGYFRRIDDVEGAEVRAQANLDKVSTEIEDPWAPLEEADAPDGSDY